MNLWRAFRYSQWWQEMPTWRRILLGATALAILGLMISLIYGQFT
jgi:fumarate reductase subunit C